MADELLAVEPRLKKAWMAGALLGRLGVPEDFKAPAVLLLASGSSFMTGADLRVDEALCIGLIELTTLLVTRCSA